MKFLAGVGNFLGFVLKLLLSSAVATFFLTVFIPDKVQNAVEIFKNFF